MDGYLDGPDAVTEVPLVPDTGIEGEAAFAGLLQAAPVRLADLGDCGDLVGLCPQPGGEGDLVSGVQGVDLSKVVVGSPVVRRETDVASPYGGVLEVSHALGERGAAGAFVDLDIQVQDRDFQPAQVASVVIEIICHLGVCDGVCYGGPGRGGEGRGAGLIHRPAAAGGGRDCCAATGRSKHSASAGGRQDCDGGHAAVDHSAGPGLGLRGQVGSEIFAAAGQVRRGRSEAGRDEGGVFADIRVFPLAVVAGVDHLDRGGFSVAGPSGRVDAVLQRSGGNREDQRSQHRQKQVFFHNASFPPPALLTLGRRHFIIWIFLVLEDHWQRRNET